MNLYNVPFGVWNNIIMVVYSLIIGFFVAYDYGTIVSSSITLAAYAIVCIAICYVSYEENSFEWILNILVLLATLCALYAFFFGSLWKGYGKTLSTINNPHFFAAVMNLGTFSIVYRIKDVGKKLAALWIVLIGFFLYSIIECGSRKYLIATSLMLLIWIVTTLKDKWVQGDSQQKFIAIIVFLSTISIVCYFYNRFYLNSDSFSRMMNNDDLGNQNRIEFYKKALEIFREYPLFGGGYDQFRYWSKIGGYAHSTYAEAIADFGFVGCVIYFSPIVFTSYNIIKRSFHNHMEYRSTQLLAFCIAELFIGIGQIFFMEFHHFIAWTILFYYSYKSEDYNPYNVKYNRKNYKYIRNY